MIEFMRAGGWGMGLVLLLGAATLVTAVLFARQPDERRMSMIRALSVASGFSILTAVSSNIAAVMYKVPELFAGKAADAMLRVAMVGVGESLSPVILGGAFLTLAWLVAAVGMRRLSDRLSALPREALSS